jgi:hypothetical protein
MRLFWRRDHFVFRIEKSVSGKYLNSPRSWKQCGYVRAADRGEAAVKACFAVGSSQVRVIPEDPA